MHLQQPLEIMDVVVQLRDEQQGLIAECLPQPADVALVAAGQHVVVVEVLGHALGEVAGQYA